MHTIIWRRSPWVPTFDESDLIKEGGTLRINAVKRNAKKNKVQVKQCIG
jgi:hypothetical protein